MPDSRVGQSERSGAAIPQPEQSESLADAVVEAIQRAKASVNTGEKWTVTLPFHNWAKIVRLAEDVRRTKVHPDA